MNNLKIVFVSNYLNHHQIPSCNEYIKYASEFTFVTTESEANEGFQKNTDAEYVLHYDRENDREKVISKILEADVAIMGVCPTELISLRMSTKKLTFLYSERFFKRAIWRRFIPITRKKINEKIGRYKNENMYVLASSAYLPYDLSFFKFPISKIFKWGYFPQAVEYANIEELVDNKKKNSIVWVGRFIDWKHPEYAVELANKLKNNNIDFKLTMIGDGERFEVIKNMVNQNNLQNNVHLVGSQSPEKVREYMEKSEIFMFTSDKNEGWGAVLNEAMNSACAVVASNRIGSVPFLINDGVNGLVFESGNVDELYLKVKELLENQKKRWLFGVNAYKSIYEQWNAKNAIQRLFKLIDALQNDNDTPFSDGVCSKVKIIKG